LGQGGGHTGYTARREGRPPIGYDGNPDLGIGVKCGYNPGKIAVSQARDGQAPAVTAFFDRLAEWTGQSVYDNVYSVRLLFFDMGIGVCLRRCDGNRSGRPTNRKGCKGGGYMANGKAATSRLTPREEPPHV
jgi:hypothetical protein